MKAFDEIDEYAMYLENAQVWYTYWLVKRWTWPL